MTWLPDLLALVDAIHRRWPDHNHTPSGLHGCTCPHPPDRHDYEGCTAQAEVDSPQGRKAP